MKNFFGKNKKGFVLIEVLVALFIFSLVMTVSIGSVVMAIDVNRKTQSLKSVINNLNQALDEMTKALAVGKNFGDASGPDPGITFTDQYGDTVTYRFEDSSIWRKINPQQGPSSNVRLTARDITMENMEFHISGNEPGDIIQPKVNVVLKGKVKAGPRYETDFFMQTAVSQRVPDFEYD